MGKSVAIVGAGISGLTAACLLHKLGFKILLLERSKRVGGRLHSIWQGNTQLALGAMWLHGLDGNPLMPLMQKYKVFEPRPNDDSLGDCCIEEESYHYNYSICGARTDTGQPVDLGIVQRMDKIVRKALDEATELDEEVAVGKFNDSLGAFVESRLEGVATDELTLAARRSILLLYANVEGVADLADVSLMGNMQANELPGNRFAHGGFSLLADRLSEHLPASCIQLDAPVQSVETETEGETSALVNVNGEGRRFDHVLLTSPLSTLPDLLPAKPDSERQRRLRAVNQLELGVVDKIFIKFDNPPQLDCRHLWLLRTQRLGNWLDGIFCITVVNQCGDTWLTWLGGEFATEMEAKTDEELTCDLLPFLSKTLATSLPNIVSIVRTRYGSDPLFRGSYCHFKPGCDINAIRQLAEPIWSIGNDGQKRPSILFAGEHCSPEFYSTVHGAFNSGLRAVQTLAKFYGIERTDDELIAML